MTLESTILNQEVHVHGVETVILDCRKSGYRIENACETNFIMVYFPQRITEH